jgi:hypothetical protein
MVLVPLKKHRLTRAQFEQLTDVPPEEALFRPVMRNRTGRLDRHLDPASVYQNIALSGVAFGQ